MNIEIISNINMDSLKFYMKEHRFLNRCSYGNYMIDLVDKNSSIYKSNSEIIIFFIDIDELHDSIDDILYALGKFIKQTNKTVILNTVCFSPHYLDTFLHHSFEKELNINLKMLNFSKTHQNALLFDFAKLVKQENFFDDKYWYMARIKYTKKGFEMIANEINNLINTYKYGSKKVLVLDMDNTLWGGIVGEDEIQLSNDGIGKAYLDFQKKIKELKKFGVLLAINSKNNYDDGLKGLKHPNSILKEDDFIIKKINWKDKVTNMKDIINELNLSADSLVFIDDNPVEREYVKNIMPETNVPEFPENIYELNSWFLTIIEKYFSKISLTEEDLKKHKQYEAKIKRDTLLKNISYDDFIKSLNIKLNFYVDDDKYAERYAQMTQKTNQFNLTTKRYTIADIKKFIKSNNHKIIAVDYHDKFAHEGIIGLIITNENDKYIVIDTFLLSCRVLKRGVENAIFKKIDDIYPEKDIIGIYIPTKKNMQVKNLYKDFGFIQISENKFVKKRRKSGAKNN